MSMRYKNFLRSYKLSGSIHFFAVLLLKFRILRSFGTFFYLLPHERPFFVPRIALHVLVATVTPIRSDFFRASSPCRFAPALVNYLHPQSQCPSHNCPPATHSGVVVPNKGRIPCLHTNLNISCPG
jgi:hypothetical protein